MGILFFYVVAFDRELRLHWQLAFRELHRFFRRGNVHTPRFEQDGSRLDNGHPILGSTLTLTHTNFGGFTRYGLIREDTYPNLTFTLHCACYGNTCRLKLA